MTITVQSAKAKGRNLQKWVRDLILKLFPNLTDQDVRSTAMGSQGVDVQLSTAASKLVPYAIECKNHKRHSVYTLYDQAVSNSSQYEPLLILKQDRRKPLAVVDAEHLFQLIKELNGYR